MEDYSRSSSLPNTFRDSNDVYNNCFVFRFINIEYIFKISSTTSQLASEPELNKKQMNYYAESSESVNQVNEPNRSQMLFDYSPNQNHIIKIVYLTILIRFDSIFARKSTFFFSFFLSPLSETCEGESTLFCIHKWLKASKGKRTRKKSED